MSPELGRVDPEHVVAIHLNAASAGFIPWGEVDAAELETFTDDEKARLGRIQQFLSDEGSAYFQVQANRPQTIAYSLTDSPVGLLAWIGRPDARLGPRAIGAGADRDQMLTNVMFYWVTGTAGSAARMYYENMHAAADWGGHLR